MNAPLYNSELLRLAASVPFEARLDAPHATAERRAPLCGSRITIDIDLGGDGRVRAIGMVVRACALGQASAALLAGHVEGRSAAELAEARDALAAWLAGERDMAPDWPGIAALAPAIPHHGRHGAILLPFQAAAEAAAAAEAR